MKPLSILVSALVLCLGLALAAHAAEFSADIVRTGTGMPASTGKAYIKADKIRMEATMYGNTQITITDPAAKKAYMIQPAQMMYMEMALDPSRMGPESMKDGPSDLGQWRTVGKETIDGWECEKRIFEFKDKSKGEMTAWFANKIGHPIKSVVKEGSMDMTMEYKNIKTGNVDASLFTVPAGYQKMTIPNMGGQGTPPGKGGKPGM